ncbi:MAG: hypothetical protein EBS21_09015 [Sphingomonadaceae bacterium]|nr:hypothetical protein [Sphingomonadaceae bacterium]
MPEKHAMNVGLNAFLKLAALDMSQQMAEVAKRIASDASGYDYYRTLRSAIKAFIDDKGIDKINSILASAPTLAEREYNTQAYQRFVEKFGKSRKRLSLFQGAATLSLARKRLKVSVRPTFMLETKNGVEVYHVWAIQKPELKRHLGAMGCFICNEAFRNTQYSNYEFKLFDTVGNRISAKPANASSTLSEKTGLDILHWAEIAST